MPEQTAIVTKPSVAHRLAAFAQELRNDQRGASFVEYIIVVGLVAIIAIVAFQNFGKAVVTKLTAETAAVNGLQIQGGGGGGN